MRSIKLILILFVSILLVSVLYLQQCCTNNYCYIRIKDNSGVDTDEFQDSLQASACRLVKAFPNDFQNNFKVYDFEFYKHTENFEDDFPEVYEQVKETITSPYYLLFRRHTDRTEGYTKVWVDLKLPETGKFSCITETQIKILENTLLVKFKGDSISINPVDYWKREMEIMKYLSKRIGSIIDCCELTGRDTLCSKCPTYEELITYYISKGYEEFDIKIVRDTNGLPVEIINEENTNILNYCDYLYELDGHVYAPVSELDGELPKSDKAIGITLSRSSLCGNPNPSAVKNRSNKIDPITLFNNDFIIQGKILIIVSQIVEHPNGGQDKLFKKYFWPKVELAELIMEPLKCDISYSIGDFRYRIISVSNTPDGQNRELVSVYLKDLKQKSKEEIVDFLYEFNKKRSVDSLYSMEYGGYNKVNNVVDSSKGYLVELINENIIKPYEARYVAVFIVDKSDSKRLCLRYFWGGPNFELDTCITKKY